MSECIIKQVGVQTKQVAPKNESKLKFVGMVNSQGRMVRSSQHGIVALDRHTWEMFLMEIALQTRMQADFDECFDSVKYSLTERGQMKFLSVPTPEHNTIVAIMDKQTDHISIMEKVRAAVSSGTMLDFNHLVEKGVKL